MCAHVRDSCIVTLLVMLVPVIARAQASAFEVGPYLSQLSARSAVIRVETATSQDVVVTAEPGKLRVTDTAHVGVHSLTLDNLQPKTTYRYSAAVANHTEEGTFTTAPPDDDVGNIRFILYGDDRGGADGSGIHRSIVKRMLDEPADFLVNTGDLVADGRVAAQWENFFDIEHDLLRERCLFPAIGNHDLVEESGQSVLKYFGTLEQQQKHVFFNTFRWGYLRFFVVNGEGSFVGDDRVWLERELQKADAEPGLVWRIVVIHNGPFASGLHGDNEKLHAAELPKLLRDHHIDFVLEGHDHIYERGESDGMRYIVSGGAGAPLYPIRHLRATARKAESTYHYVLLDFVNDKGKLIAKRLDGSVLDDVGFSKTSFWDEELSNTPGVTTRDTGVDEPSVSDSKPVDDRKSSSSGVPFAAAGLLAVVGAWFWISRRRRH
jgi:MYXO-CTERM domain-containing protein